MDRAEKRKKQREYYRQHIDQLRARAKLYRERWTEEQRKKKRERDLAYYHRTKNLIARRRRVARQERSADQRENDKQQRRVRNKTEYAREKHRQDSKKFYYKHREVILKRQREYYRNHSERILTKQKEYKQKREAKKMGPPAPVGGGVSANERWDVQWQLQRRLDECRRRCWYDVPFHFTVYAVIGEADVVVPPEPFPFARQSLDTMIELL